MNTSLHDEFEQAKVIAAFDPSFEWIKRSAHEKVFMRGLRKCLEKSQKEVKSHEDHLEGIQ